MKKIDKILSWIDKSSEAGRFLIYIIYIQVGIIVYHVFGRYAFGWPVVWAYDVEYMLLAAVFCLPMAYAALHQAHVRIDLVPRRFPPKVQELLMCVSYLCFVIPIAVVLIIYGWEFAMASWSGREVTVSGARLLVYPVKFCLPLAGLLLLLAAVAELTRHVTLLVRSIKA